MSPLESSSPVFDSQIRNVKDLEASRSIMSKQCRSPCFGVIFMPSTEGFKMKILSVHQR